MFYQMLRDIWQALARRNDRLYRGGADFSTWMTQERAGFEKERGNQYQPTTDRLVKVLQRFSINEKDAILDLGCGKGKAMYLMSHFPFRLIRGYDLSEELVNIANQNFERLHLQNCRAFLADAVDFKEYDEYNYFFVNNSFPHAVFKAMMKNLQESARRNPRRIRFIYLNPVCHRFMVESTPFRLIYKKRSLVSWFTYHCYELEGQP